MFGSYEYPKAMYDLLHLKQTGSMYDLLHLKQTVHNPEMDEIFFVTQFVKGLKDEIQGPVLCQIPTTVNRVVLLAQLHQDVLAKSRAKS
jgi:hypothetical protein